MTNKQIIILILAFTLVAVFCATGVFAVQTPLEVPVSQPFASGAGDSAFASADLKLFTFNGYQNKGLAVSSVDSDVFVFRYSGSNPSNFYFCLASLSDFSASVLRYNTSYGWATLSFPGNASINFDSTSALYYYSFNVPGSDNDITVNSSLPTYPSVSEGLSELSSVIAVGAFSQSMTINPGYALRIYSNDSITLQQIVYTVSDSWNYPSLSGSSSRYNGDRFGLYPDELVVQGGSADRGSFVPWNALNSNLFGRASSYSYNYEFYDDYILYNTYSYVITNPLYAGEAVQNESAAFNQNTPVNVTVYYNALSSSQVFFDLVPLYQSLTASDGVIYYQNTFDLNSGVIHGTITPGEGDDPGTVDFGAPPAGGGNADQPPLSENTTIFGILSTLTSTITNLFNRAADAMQGLVQSCNSFFTALIGLFGWLPAEWSAVLWSFFIILTVLGVVKLFL